MATTNELIAGVELLYDDLIEAQEQAGAAVACAQELVDDAAGRGWPTVAERVQAAGDSLRTAIERIDAARDTTAAASDTLREINPEMDPEEIEGRLTSAAESLTGARSIVLDAAKDVADARLAAEDTRSNRLLDLLQDADRSLTRAHESAEAAHTATTTEQERSTTWGN